MSPLAKKVLANPVTREQLLDFMMQNELGEDPEPIVLRITDDDGRELELTPVYVPSAS